MSKFPRLEKEKLLVLCVAFIGLAYCVPGFRPKHVRDIIVGLFSLRGLGILLYFFVMALLLPTCHRLKRMAVVQTHLGGLFTCLGFLLLLELIAINIGLSQSASVWLVRLSYLVIVLWGLVSSNEFSAFFRLHTKEIWESLPNIWWKIFACIVLFFLICQELHLYLSRGTPFPPSGDEVQTWYACAQKILHLGLAENIHTSPYTPGIPWLTSLPQRILGLAIDDWLYAYPLFIMSAFLFFIFTNTKGNRLLFCKQRSKESAVGAVGFGFWAALFTLHFVFLSCRDLHYLFGATLYGEAIATLLTAVLLANILYRKSKATCLENLATGIFLGFCALSKPPISSLAPIVACFVAILAVFTHTSWRHRICSVVFILAGTLVPLQLWKIALVTGGLHSEYSFKLSAIFEHGVKLSIPLKMVTGLANKGSPQLAFSLGLLITLVLGILQKNKRFVFTIVAANVVYWGFVLGLYATLWQGVEQYSAGRYLSHSAIASVLLIPLAY